MTVKLIHQNLNCKDIIILFPLFFYWLFIHVCLGYFLSQAFYRYFDSLNIKNPLKSVRFRQQINLTNLRKFLINSILKFFEIWLRRLHKKGIMLCKTIFGLIRMFILFISQLTKSSQLKYQLLELKDFVTMLLCVIPEGIAIFSEVQTEFYLLFSIFAYIGNWKKFILFLMAESRLVTNKLIYILLIFIFGIFALILGFLIGMKKRQNDVYLFISLFLLEIINNLKSASNITLINNLLEPIQENEFSKFSLRTIEHVLPTSKIMLKKPDDPISFPFFMINESPSVVIQTEILYDTLSIDSNEFKLFKFYQNRIPIDHSN